MLSQTLKIAIVGCGKMAANHLEKCLHAVPRTNIALCDREIIKSRLLGEMFDIPNVYDSLDAIMGEFRPDICHIVTPPATHKQLAIACMRGGGHVYIEKPICLTTKDFDELMRVAEKCERLVCAGHQRIFETVFAKIRELIGSGKLGRVIHVHAYDSGPYLDLEDRGLSKGWWNGFTGGMFLDILPHIVSMFAELADDLRLQHSFLRTDAHNRPSELHGFLSSGSSQITCSFHISFSTRFDQNYLQVECEKGVIVLDGRMRSWYVSRKSTLPEIAQRLTRSYSAALKMALAHSGSILNLLVGRYDPYEGTGILIERFYDAVREKKESPTPIPVVRKVVELCEQTIQASFGAFQHRESGPSAKFEAPHPDRTEVLVTGAGGFIGTHLVRRLLQEGRTVRAMVRRPVSEGHFGPGHKGTLQVVMGDLLDGDFVSRACKGVELIFHLAAATKGDLFTQVEGTCIGTKNVLKGVKEHSVKKLVYVSSLSVLDQTNFPRCGIVGDYFPLERHPLKRGAYAYSKLKAEEIVRAFQAEHDNVRIAILRPGSVWGPGSEQPALETHFGLGRRILLVLGQAGKRLPLIYVENLVDVIVKAGVAGMLSNGPMNIVDPANPSQKECLELLGNITGKRRFTLFIPIPAAMPLFWVAEKALGFMLNKRLNICYQLRSKINRASYTAEGARTVLGWESEVSFREGLTRYLDWLKAGRNNH